MIHAKLASTPLATSLPLTLHVGTPLSDPTDYSTIVRSFHYLSLTCPDIASIVNKLSQSMHKLTTTHWAIAKCLLRYLCGTIAHEITLRCTSSPHSCLLQCLPGNKDDFTSTSSQIVYLGHNSIFWSSKK